ncbi:MAG TPA: hypothetical protein DD490_29010, partial [Acidobacteria bacterium]|nr:hypothetical protein [Acidobacteriota bacterium]
KEAEQEAAATAWRRLRAEQSPPEPTARDVEPGPWSVEGQIRADGEVALQVTGTMRNTGREPQGHLAFALNPELVLEAATADGGRVRPARSWDRLTVELDPPLAAGESRELHFRLSGRPASIVFPGLPKPDMLVDEAPGAHQRKRPGRDLVDLTASYRIPAVSGLRVVLEAEDLLPVPRYGPWTRNDRYGQVTIAEEVNFPRAEIQLALTVPPDLFLADACGGLARGGRLESRCALPLPEVMVAGGRQRPLGTGEAGGATVAVFPSHRAAGELHLGFLERGSRMMGEAWPGLGGLADMVVLEWPARSIHGRASAFWFFEDFEPFSARAPIELHGRLVFLAEARLIQTRPVNPDALVANVVASRLAARRLLDPDRQAFFFDFFRALALQRLGLGAERGAVVGPLDLRYIPFVQKAALDPQTDSIYQSLRFRALVAALEHRAGREPLRAAVDELLSLPGERPATFEDFEAILRRHAREPVDAMLRDFFHAGRLPELVLEDVVFRRAGGGWRATGRVHNLADGETSCRVVLAAASPVETTVTVGTGGSAFFDLATPHTPQAVFLDPDLECHRLERVGAPRDRVFFSEGRR